MENLRQKPFYLSDEDIKWVENTLEGMTLEEKVGQLFCLVAYSDDKEYLKNLLDTVKPCGIMCRAMSLEQVVETNRFLQENSKLPMLISENLEKRVSNSSGYSTLVIIKITDSVEIGIASIIRGISPVSKPNS